MTKKLVFPLFVFARRRDVELEAGFTLAGQLLMDEPKPKDGEPMPEGLRDAISRVIGELTKMREAGAMPDDAIAFGWPGGGEPANAVDTDDDELMAAWAKDRLSIGVRVDPRPGPSAGGSLRVDSDMLRQMGLTSKGKIVL